MEAYELLSRNAVEVVTDEEAREMLELLELDHVSDERAGNLSGGQRKLLELGRVLMIEPEVILLDEPVAGVNPSLTDELLARLEELNDRGRTILFIEHDMDVVLSISDRISVLNRGSLIATGPPEEIQANDAVQDAYLGGMREEL